MPVLLSLGSSLSFCTILGTDQLLKHLEAASGRRTHLSISLGLRLGGIEIGRDRHQRGLSVGEGVINAILLEMLEEATHVGEEFSVVGALIAGNSVDACRLLTSPTYHLVRKWHGLPELAFLGQELAYIRDDPNLALPAQLGAAPSDQAATTP